ncbi:MAG: FG-GAP repeat protein [Silvanigrellaceae bacterium]
MNRNPCRAVLPSLLSLIPVVSSASQIANNPHFTIEKKATISINKPGYLSLVTDPSTRAPHLLVSTFQAFGKDNLYSIANWDKGLAEPELLDTANLNNQITWPNEARMADNQLFGQEGLIVSGGFLVPGKSTGAISFVPWSQPQSHRTITTPKKGWYYHRTEEYDVNGDGLLDLVTARGTIPMMGKPDGELIWLENPGNSNSNEPWKEHFIARGPDVHFRILNKAPSKQAAMLPLTIVTTEFSARKLSVYQQNAAGAFDFHRLDDTLGAAFDIQIEDLNSDGAPELLVTNHEPDAKASVFAYEFDIQTLKIIKRHTLLTGIETRQKGIKQASPGTVLAFRTSTNPKQANLKSWILVSGDGSQRAHLLVPQSDTDPLNWSYDQFEIWDAKSTVGQSVVGDVDGDGQPEIFVPAYDANQVAVFKINAKKISPFNRRRRSE